MIKKSDLDKRICDVEGGWSTKTYREFIRQCENDFDMDNADLDNMSEKDLNDHIDFLDYLCGK